MTRSLVVTDPTSMRALGERIGHAARAGDVIVLDGELGAGKTTLTQGIARGLGVGDSVTSPTFVIARMHKGTVCTFVHVDAYRVGSRVEIDDLDLPWDESVTVIEWGGEWFPYAALHVNIEATSDDQRIVTLTAREPRWSDDD